MQLIVMIEFANQFPVNFITNWGYISKDNFIGISVYLTVVECFLIVTTGVPGSQVFLHCPGKWIVAGAKTKKSVTPKIPMGKISKCANKPNGSPPECRQHFSPKTEISTIFKLRSEDPTARQIPKISPNHPNVATGSQSTET